MSQQTIKIDGMSCGHCVARVRKALETVADVKVIDVKVGEARVETPPGLPVEQAVRRALDDAGYPVVAVTPS